MPTAPQSLPVSPAQPEQDTYSPSDLALFKIYNRDSYRVAFGVEAPPYDPSRLIKTWFDSSVDLNDPSDVVLYRTIGPDTKGQWGYRQLVLAVGEAASVNLPGAVTYPAYVIAPTKATRGGGGLWPDYLSQESDALSLLMELGITAALYDAAENPVFPVNYGDETRRQWSFKYRGSEYNVGRLLTGKYQSGVGAPGHWKVGENIEWIADPAAPTGFDDQRPPRPCPVRELRANETLAQTLMGLVILRTDRRQAQLENVAQNPGQFTAADRAMLREIREIVTQLASK
jgi:hypothetical protein